MPLTKNIQNNYAKLTSSQASQLKPFTESVSTKDSEVQSLRINGKNDNVLGKRCAQTESHLSRLYEKSHTTFPTKTTTTTTTAKTTDPTAPTTTGAAIGRTSYSFTSYFDKIQQTLNEIASKVNDIHENIEVESAELCPQQCPQCGFEICDVPSEPESNAGYETSQI